MQSPNHNVTPRDRFPTLPPLRRLTTLPIREFVIPVKGHRVGLQLVLYDVCDSGRLYLGEYACTEGVRGHEYL